MQEKSLNRQWYKELKQSELTPPSYVFGIVWSFLYFLMALYFIFALPLKGSQYGILYFMIQLIVNLSWTYVFFRKKKYILAFWMIIFMLIFTLLSMWEIYKLNKLIPLLLVPYILWLSLAGYLNLFIVINN